MPIESPRLDDLEFEALFELLRKRIAIHAPEWTDHNESDPGITLLQLFSFLGEQIGYRLNRVPDKNYVEFLKLIGMRLRPAEASTTRLALVLASPATASAFAVRAGAEAQADAGDPPPAFQVSEETLAVPAQLAALVTTRYGDLRDLSLIEAPARVDPIGDADDPDAYVDARFEVAWDGKTPKLKDMPAQPVPVASRPTSASHANAWLGLAFNPARPAGFVGQRVTLTVQLDDDEQPSSLAIGRCGDDTSGPAVGAAAVEYVYYRPARPTETRGSWQPLRPLSDTTDGWMQSGRVRFDVLADIGPIPDDEWVAVREEVVKTTEQICAEASSDPTAPAIPEPVPHPLIGALAVSVPGTPTDVPVSGWIGVRFLDGPAPQLSVRALSFNVVPAANASIAGPEILGRGTGLPGQTLSTTHANILTDSLHVAVESLEDAQLATWREVDSFDAEGPLATVFTVDREAGAIGFGDGVRGLPPPPNARVVAVRPGCSRS